MVDKNVKNDVVKRPEFTKKTMGGRMFNATVRYVKTREELRRRLEIESISEAMRMGSLSWFGQI